MTETIKVCLLDLEAKRLSAIMPLDYVPGKEFSSFLGRAIPLLVGKDFQCFTSGFDKPVLRLQDEDFLGQGFWHVLAVLLSDKVPFQDKEGLFQMVEARLGKETKDSIQGFAFRAAPPPDVFENNMRSFRAIPVPVSLQDYFTGYHEVFGMHETALNDGKESALEMLYHNRVTLRSLLLPASLFNEGKGTVTDHEISVLRDIAAKEVVFRFNHIESAIVEGDLLHVEHKREDGSVEMKTLTLETWEGTGDAPRRRYRDTGNRIRAMNFLNVLPEARGLGLPFSFARPIQRFLLPKREALLREFLRDLRGEICDIHQVGPNDYYLLTWDKARSEARIWHSFVGGRLPGQEECIVFSAENRPGPMVLIEKIDSFLLSMEAPTGRLFLLSRTSRSRTLDEISSVFSAYRDGTVVQGFGAFGSVRDLFVSRVEVRGERAPVVTIVQEGRIGIFLIVPEIWPLRKQISNPERGSCSL